MKKLIILIAILIPCVCFSSGIGIAPSKLVVNEPVIKNKNYILNPITIVNLGDTTVEYEVLVSDAVREGFEKINPAWIKLKPKKFTLVGGGVQQVEVRLRIPKSYFSTNPHFGIIEGRQVREEGGGQGITGSVGSIIELTISDKSQGFIGNMMASVYSFGKAVPTWIYAVVLSAIPITLFKKKFKITKR